MSRPMTQLRRDYLDGKCTQRGLYYKEHIKCSPHIWEDMHFPTESKKIAFIDKYLRECERLKVDQIENGLGTIIRRITKVRLYKDAFEVWK